MPQGKLDFKKYGRIAWQAALALLAALCLALIGKLWLASSQETEDAFSSGRRLVIAIDSGEVKGKILTLDTPVVPSVAETPPPPPADTETAVETALPPAGTETETEKAEETPATPVTPMPDVNPSLTEHTPEGDLPVIGADGTKPWRYYSKPFERKRNQPMVAVIVSGLGIGRDVTQQALRLHENISVSFSPYARDIGSWRAAIRATGHEMLIDLPLQPANYPLTDPGPYGLILEKGDTEATRRLQGMMMRFPTSIGFLTPQSEVFTANDEAMKLLLQALASRGLMLVMGNEPPKKETKDLIDANTAIATATGNLLLDEEQSPAAIQTRLMQLEEQAKKQGYAIGVAQAYPLTIEQLRLWSASLAEKGILLVPVSAIVKLRFS